MSSPKYPIHGSCQCGQVQYELLEPPLFVAACHCKECQKLSTSAFSITAMVKADSVRFQGEMQEWSRVAESGNVSAAKFCTVCGNRMYHYNPEEPDRLKLKPANLNDTRVIQPTMHIWVSEKQEWYQIPECVEVFMKQP